MLTPDPGAPLGDRNNRARDAAGFAVGLVTGLNSPEVSRAGGTPLQPDD